MRFEFRFIWALGLTILGLSKRCRVTAALSFFAEWNTDIREPFFGWQLAGVIDIDFVGWGVPRRMTAVGQPRAIQPAICVAKGVVMAFMT